MERRQQRKKAKGFSPTVPLKGWTKKFIFVGALITIMFILTINILIWTSDVSKLESPLPQPTIIYDKNGEIAAKISNSTIDGVELDQIPETVVQAVIATEDQRFYKHNGINYVAIIRASFQNMISGDIVAGGSTITQQLAKNVFLTHERTFIRKFKEFILTKKIERTYSKDEIIERYLNHIYYGEGAWGIQQAAQIYFGKNVNELTLSESAMLAGLIKAPSNLSPIKNLDKSVERRNIVLSLMLNEGYITQNELDNAKAERIVLEGKKIDDKYKGKYPYYVDHIIDEAIKKFNLTENEVLSGGLHITTELNPAIQNAVEEVFNDDHLFPKSKPDQLIQSGGVFVNPSTGGISALVGGRGKHTFRGFNHATQLIRQPGSIMKPLAVYTPALEQGYDIYDTLEDRPLNIDGYQPKNYDNQFRGQTTMYNAVIHSYNVPAVWLLNKMGIEYGTNALERFGITLEEEDHSLGIALGGMSKGTSPLLMAQAFSTFPNNGLMVEAHAIKKIEDSNGYTLGKWQDHATQVTDPDVAQKISFMLKGVVSEGTGKNSQVDGIEIAGKTGTTEFPAGGENGAKDHWFAGYTSDLSGAIWLGYDKTDENHFLTSTSGSTAAVIFGEIISRSADELSKGKLELPLVKKEYTEELKKHRKEEEETKKAKEKQREEAKKAAEKQKEEVKKAAEKRREEAKKAAEKQRKEEKKAKEKLKKEEKKD